MDEIEWIKSLDSTEPAARVDVAAHVIRAIRQLERSQTEQAGISSLAAVLATLLGGGCALFALQMWLAMQDPLASFLEPLRLVLQ